MPKIPKQARRNPEAPHVKEYAKYREREAKPKAMLSSSRGMPLTLKRYEALMQDYTERAKSHLERQDVFAELTKARGRITPQLKEFRGFREALGPIYSATVSPHSSGYSIAREIVSDFGRTKGLRVFGFGAGYAQLLFFLKNFMGAKVKGVDLGTFSKRFTQSRKLRVMHGKSVADTSLRHFGKFDVTYSINVLEDDIIDRTNAIGMLDNMAHLTRKGGKSYHIVLFPDKVPLSKKEIEAKVSKWTNGKKPPPKFFS